MSQSLATIVGGAAAGLIMVVLVIGFLWFCMVRCKKFSNRNSETGSSDPSALVEWNRGGGSTSARGHPLSGPQGVTLFNLEDLEQATNKFNDSSLIGEGSFGLVYKGLLLDGTVVAVKRRLSAPQRAFVEEVHYLSQIWHRNLVTLLGYCEEDGFQMLVFEYLPNGSVSDHLYGKNSTTKLEFKRRLSIALAAAKGLCHLHCLNPPLVHKNFKTSNVLVDENFIAKVADAGVLKLLDRTNDAIPSSLTSGGSTFQDPEFGGMGIVSQRMDVYSFGVFLLEIVSGEEASKINLTGSGENLKQRVKSGVASNNIVDRRLAESFTLEGMKDLISLTLQCLSIDGEAAGLPNMNMIVSELDKILAREMTWKTVMGEGTATFTLGSQLFTTG
ncbi:hypothetical protein IFM89_016488 [Coptis chinensis]|uniref:non-specific serine/threonine protein kinase n=1 Tax=Coptis chinensis TaxID=261450 RepID=A0A835HXY2_9MAGN|nr:hypothetical protein IFM89_016488 [Coptis chinensis]